MSLQITDLHKSFEGQVALERITLTVGSAEFVCLLGPSGCGKTTLLRIVAGLLPADGGAITLGGRNLATLPARERGFGIVFQSYSLFPHMTVAQNVGYGLAIRNTPRSSHQGAGGRAAGHGGPGRLRRALPGAAVGWPAAARGDCPCAGGEPLAAAARRAPVGAGRARARRPAP